MTVPASTQSLQDAFATGNREMLRVKSILEDISTQSLSQDVRVQRIVNALVALRQLETTLNTVISYGADMLAYAQEQYRDPTFPAGDYITVRDNTTAMITWIESAMADGTAITQTLNGVSVDNTYTTAQLATFRTHSATFASAIS